MSLTKRSPLKEEGHSSLFSCIYQHLELTAVFIHCLHDSLQQCVEPYTDGANYTNTWTLSTSKHLMYLLSTHSSTTIAFIPNCCHSL